MRARSHPSLFDPPQDALFGAAAFDPKPTVAIRLPDVDRLDLGALAPAPGRTYKTLSLWQPWASLCVHPLEVYRKRYETRSWPCPSWLMGREVAIHATKTLQREAREFVEDAIDDGETFFTDAFDGLGLSLDELPLGAVLGVVRVVECLRMERVNPTTQEVAFGDYEPGRYAWRLELVESFPEPIPARGAQKIWDWEDPRSVAA